MQKYSDFLHNWLCISVITERKYKDSAGRIFKRLYPSPALQLLLKIQPSLDRPLLFIYSQPCSLTIKIHLTVSWTVMYNSGQTIMLIDAQVSNTFPCKYMSLNFLFLIRVTKLIQVVRQNNLISLEFDVMIAHGYPLSLFKFDNKVA